MLIRKFAAELLGTGMLLAAVVGSGIAGEQLSGGNVAIALLANSIATGGILMAVILAFGDISGAHLNPVVSVSAAVQGRMPWGEVPVYLVAQVVGAFCGVAGANMMFGFPAFVASRHVRSGSPQLLSELVATFGLLAIIWGCVRGRPSAAAAAVAAYITAAYWFTASTSFANPAVTLARAATDTFSGIRPADVPGFLFAQVIGAAMATAVFRFLEEKHDS